MIDIDKLVCSLLNYRVGLLDQYNRFEDALKEQGIEYKDGSLHYIGEEIKHKHKVGDWLVENEPNNYARFAQILEIVDIQGRGRYRISRDIHNDEDIVECRFMEKHYHPFNIQDAKPGDMLYDKSERGVEFVVMFKEFNECGSIDSYFRYNSEVGFGVNVPSVLSSKDNHTTPATKEQKNFLFQKMEEAGYKWNPDTLTLEKIEKPATIKFEEEVDAKVEVLKNDPKKQRLEKEIHDWFKNEGYKPGNKIVVIPIFKEPDFDDMVLKAEMKYQLSPDALGLYRKGLEDMWNKMKKGE